MAIRKMNQYDKQASKFLNDTKSTINIEYMETRPYFKDDKESRDVYRFTIKNKHGYYSADYGDSVHNTGLRLSGKTGDNGKTLHETPRPYDILACLGVFYPDNYNEFADEFGYDRDSLSGLEIFQACKKEQAGLDDIFEADQLQQLAEIS